MPFYLSDYFLGARTLYKELVEIFSVPAERGYLNLELAGNDYRPAVNFLNEFGFPYVIAEGEDVDFETYMWTLEHISPAEGVNYEVEPIEYLDRGMSALEQENIRILHGFRVKPQHLELIPSAESNTIEDSSFTGADINEFLKRLKGGSNPNLKEAQLLLDGTYDEEEALSGLDATEEDDGRFTMKLDNGDIYEFVLGDDIFQVARPGVIKLSGN